MVEEKKIGGVIREVPKDAFTVLDFTEVFKEMHPQDWRMLVEKFSLFRSRRRCTVSTYLSNLLDVYSHKPHSTLVSLTTWSKGGFRDYRKTTGEE